MLDYYNSKYRTLAINIDTRFPVKRLIEVMDKYIKLYLLAIYSYEDDLRIKYKSILMKRLRTFNKENPYFGRRIVSLSVKKLYYMSRLYYEENNIIFLPDNVYFPKPDMIILDQRCYLVDHSESNNYSIFPIFDSNSQSDYREQKIIELSPIIKKYTFNETQLDIIKKKYYSIACEQTNSGNITPNVLTDEADSDQDTDTYTDDIIDNEVTNNVTADNVQILDQSYDTEDTYDSDEMDETVIYPIIEQPDISIDSDTDTMDDIMDDNISINSFEEHTADVHINDSSVDSSQNIVDINTNAVNLNQQARHTLILRLDYFQRNELTNEEDYQHIIRSILQLVDDDR
jgi:hypothetical protein